MAGAAGLRRYIPIWHVHAPGGACMGPIPHPQPARLPSIKQRCNCRPAQPSRYPLRYLAKNDHVIGAHHHPLHVVDGRALLGKPQVGEGPVEGACKDSGALVWSFLYPLHRLRGVLGVCAIATGGADEYNRGAARGSPTYEVGVGRRAVGLVLQAVEGAIILVHQVCGTHDVDCRGQDPAGRQPQQPLMMDLWLGSCC